MVKKLVASSTKTRANHVKVKTGCITCKIRRVKCDEQKPECFRCLGTDRKCDGYSVEGLIDHNKCIKDLDTARVFVCTPGSIASTSISFDLPGSGRERRSFHYFRDRTVPDLSGYFRSEFWDCLVLQFCHAEPAIRHALIALGAVHETFKSTEDHTARTGHEEWDRRFALQQYNRAITNLRKHLSTSGHQSVEVALICCLLFICFESLLGNHKSALCHLESGLDILRNWRTRNIHSSSSNVWYPSSDSDIVEDHLIQVFSRLDMQATLLLDTRIPHFYTMPATYGNNATDFVPTRFAGLTEARNVLEKLGNQLACFIVLNHLDPDQPPDSVTPATIMKQAELNAQLEKWTQGYDELLKRTSTTLSINELRGAILLKLHRKAMFLMLVGGQSVSERVFDRFTDTFVEMTLLAASLLKTSGGSGSSDGSPTFAIDLGVVAPLYMTARKCSDPTVRRHAISLLHASARREALWDGAMVARIAEQIEAEKDRMVPGGVLELAQKYGVTEQGLTERPRKQQVHRNEQI